MNWISIEDRLPEKVGIYIVNCESDNGWMQTSFHWDSQNWCFDNDMSCGEALFTSAGYIKVIHWMPLPESPKK